MKKIGRILLTMALSFVFVFSFGACTPNRGQKVDKNRTQLYIGYFNGGVGDAWLNKAISAFEKKYANYEFTPGKKGAQILYGEKNKTSMAGETLKNKMQTTNSEVFFTEEVFYYEWVEKGLLYDLTDTVEAKLSEFGESGSIASKMDADLLESLKVNGKIYALPYWEGYYGLVYNAALFKEKGWYFSKTGTFTNDESNLSAGPDGEEHTYDDGLPATYDEFFALLGKISADNCTPLVWGGANKDYFTWLLSSLFADYEGADSLMLNYTFDGEATLIKNDTLTYNAATGYDALASSYETETLSINQNNGYELARQEGYLYAMKFAQDVLQNTKNYDTNICLSGSNSQAQAQLAFIRSDVSNKSDKVAMLIDGNWWENEASEAFKAVYGSANAKYDTDFKWMPLPKATKAKVAAKADNVLVSPLESYAFINAKIDPAKVELATKFLQFCHTDEMMKEFTAVTNICKPYSYSIDESRMTEFGKSISQIRNESRVVYPKSNNALYRYASLKLRISSLLTFQYTSDAYSAEPQVQFTDKKGGSYTYNYVSLYKGLYTYRKETLWKGFTSVLG